MKLLWAVSALLLSCWRTDASTGKKFVSAMLVKTVDFALVTNIKNIQSCCFCLEIVVFFDSIHHLKAAIHTKWKPFCPELVVNSHIVTLAARRNVRMFASDTFG